MNKENKLMDAVGLSYRPQPSIPVNKNELLLKWWFASPTEHKEILTSNPHLVMGFDEVDICIVMHFPTLVIRRCIPKDYDLYDPPTIVDEKY